MIFLTIAFAVICIGTVVAVVRSKKPLKLILAEAKFEILYNVMGAKSLLEDIIMRKKNTTDLPLKTGKIAVITGGTKGIGLEVIKMLLQCDLTVIIGCRNVKLGDILLEKFREDGIETGEIKVFKLDVSSMDSVRAFAEAVQNQYQKINILINNAGIMYVPYSESSDGFESQFATNYLGHFLLTHLLLDRLKEAGRKGEKSRVVNLTSIAHESGKIVFDDINCKEQYIALEAYAQSKLAQLLFSHYLNRLMETEEACVESFAVHPGIVNTDLFDGTYIKRFAPWALNLFFKTPKKGAISVVAAAVSVEFEGRGGSYVSNCQTRKPGKLVLSEDLQEQLFDFTKELLNIEEFGKQ